MWTLATDAKPVTMRLTLTWLVKACASAALEVAPSASVYLDRELKTAATPDLEEYLSSPFTTELYSTRVAASTAFAYKMAEMEYGVAVNGSDTSRHARRAKKKKAKKGKCQRWYSTCAATEHPCRWYLCLCLAAQRSVCLHELVLVVSAARRRAFCTHIKGWQPPTLVHKLVVHSY